MISHSGAPAAEAGAEKDILDGFIQHPHSGPFTKLSLVPLPTPLGWLIPGDKLGTQGRKQPRSCDACWAPRGSMDMHDKSTHLHFTDGELGPRRRRGLPESQGSGVTARISASVCLAPRCLSLLYQSVF